MHRVLPCKYSVQYFHACLPSADVILPWHWDKLWVWHSSLLWPDENHPGRAGTCDLWMRAGLGPVSSYQLPWYLGLFPLDTLAPVPRSCSSLSLLSLPVPAELPCLPAHGWTVYVNCLRGACWHFTSNHFSSTAAAVVKWFVAMATQPGLGSQVQ